MQTTDITISCITPPWVYRYCLPDVFSNVFCIEGLVISIIHGLVFIQPASRFAYNRETLLSIGEHVNKVKGNRLPPSVCVNIRKLRINKILKIKQRQKRGGRKKYMKQLACNASNLVKIRCLPQNGSMTNILSRVNVYLTFRMLLYFRSSVGSIF